MGPNITIMGGGRNFKDKDVLIINQGSYHRGVSIGSDVLLGASAIILPGCNIETGAVIGAGSLVNTNVPAYSIVAGVPAQVIGERK
jgi:acetyltransferase-like isoleucine patch superfamily enzyme